MDKRFLAIVGVIIILFVGFVLFKGGDKAEAPTANAKPTNHVRGEGKAGVTFTEYGDFQCPACELYYPAVEQAFQKYGSQVTFQFRNFPLTSLHQNAFAGARAAEAASKQGKFWDMYKQLYDNQNTWAGSTKVSSIFESYAQQLGLNVAQFKKDYASTAVNNIIRADMAAGDKLGVSSTPTFLLNGKVIQNPQATIEAFSKILDPAIAKATANQQSTDSAN